MNIEIKDYGKQAMDSGEEGWKVELMSNREGKERFRFVWNLKVLLR